MLLALLQVFCGLRASALIEATHETHCRCDKVKQEEVHRTFKILLRVNKILS